MEATSAATTTAIVMEKVITLFFQYGFPPLITGIFGLIAGIYIQRKKNRPEVVTHGCRILGQDVYTYFDPDNNTSEPACPYLLKGGKCDFKPTDKNSKPKTEWGEGGVRFWSVKDKEDMLRANDNECYLALWSQKTRQK